MFDSTSVLDRPTDGWADEAFAPLRAELENGHLALDLLREEQQVIGTSQAYRARWIADFCRARPASGDRPDTEVGAAAAATRAARSSVLVSVSEWAVDEVATALCLTAARAESWMVQSLQLVHLLPATLEALAEGRLTWEHATVLCDVVAPLDDEIRADAEARLLARLGHKTPPQLRAAAHRVVQRLDGQAIGRRVTAALRERGITVHPTGDGLGTLSVTDLPLPVVRAMEDALRQYADAAATPDDGRTRQQRMADCLVDLVLRPGEHGLAPVQAQLTIIATVRTLLGGDDPGEVAGDVVPAEMLRALARALGLLPTERPTRSAPPEDPTDAADATDTARSGLAGLLATRNLSGTALADRPQIALVDELTGQLLGLTDAAGLRAGSALGPPPTAAYAPTGALRRHVQLRDRRCRFPGCRRPGTRSDLHHVVRFPEGPTSAGNLCCLCRHHHRLVHQAPGWRLDAVAGGGLRFTTPTGYEVTTHPGGLTDGSDGLSPPGTDPPDDPPPDDDPPPF
ncbi:HNH endonuclease signature motif containing protein [Modestobacter versicolor]|uniref:HNH endonuclease signature motif containing protein n=1 Tax=Modestobacter versicolor TaxID=429133 RepID=UPI0034DE380E